MLGDWPFVSLFSDHPTTQQLQRAFFSSQIPWAPVVESRLFATCCELVSSGDSVSVVDPMTAKKYENAGIGTRRFEPEIVFEVALTLPGDGPHSLLAQDFVSAIKDHVKPFTGKFLRDGPTDAPAHTFRQVAVIDPLAMGEMGHTAIGLPFCGGPDNDGDWFGHDFPL